VIYAGSTDSILSAGSYLLPSSLRIVPSHPIFTIATTAVGIVLVEKCDVSILHFIAAEMAVSISIGRVHS
jgi:hypothetical protein